MKTINIKTSDGRTTNLRLKPNGDVSIYITDKRGMPFKHHIESFSSLNFGSVWMDIVLDYLASDEFSTKWSDYFW